MKIQLSPKELETLRLEPETLAFAVEQVKVNGYVLLEKVVPDSVIEELRQAFDPLFDEYIQKKGYNTGTNRAQMHLPFQAPFNHEYIIAHPLAMAIIDELLGQDHKCVYFASDTPMPGSDYQNVHSDIMPLFPDYSAALPAYSLVLNVPLVDTTEENGPLEIWPGGTHLNGDRTNHDTLDGSVNKHVDIVRAAEYMLSEKILMPAGSIVIRDIRMWHRGTPNRSDRRRTNIALIYNRTWFGSGHYIRIPQDTYDGLSEKGKQVFRGERIGETVTMPWEH
ncbi:hypothetical protein SY83_01575 [Paenibacillus swuensis]|uniref:Phytanoyl-CoA dioxygenase n=1 Tax=Paenibacillus swuensis TaxID=1178515 RepID=A0A172TEM0_9BACL|nr:phytanoyl-CoA dioxygenase family protein [Paenibacillus swuensis]ANE45233.1 hypothetical protein SY83_01575 [Paenibacillus swuensis]